MDDMNTVKALSHASMMTLMIERCFRIHVEIFNDALLNELRQVATLHLARANPCSYDGAERLSGE